jgi:hypothetical protein
MTDNYIPIRFVTDSLKMIEEVVIGYDGPYGPMTIEDVYENGCHRNREIIRRVGIFLLEIGGLEESQEKMRKQLRPIGKQLAQALKGNNEIDPKKCWHVVLLNSPDMCKLLTQLRRWGHHKAGFSTDELIEHLESIIETNAEHYGKSIDAKSRHQKARSVSDLIEKAEMLGKTKKSKYIIAPEIRLSPDRKQEVGVTHPMPRITSEIEITLAPHASNHPTHDTVDQRIVSKLKQLVPSAGLSYEQATLDLQVSQRLSWRGPATDLRESLRETLDYLAPDDKVTTQQGFQFEPGTNGPTMKQKVRYVMKERGMSKAATQPSEDAAEAIDAAMGGFVRSVYTRSNVSTHTPTDKDEVLRVRDLVRVAMCELLKIRQ